MFKEEIIRSIEYKKWNFEIEVEDNKIKLIPKWLEKNDEDYGKEITIESKSIGEYFLLPIEKSCHSIAELLDSIKGYYDLED